MIPQFIERDRCNAYYNFLSFAFFQDCYLLGEPSFMKSRLRKCGWVLLVGVRGRTIPQLCSLTPRG